MGRKAYAKAISFMETALAFFIFPMNVTDLIML
jgi:hypothetical protein